MANNNLKPEEQAREIIDQQLKNAGWRRIISRKDFITDATQVVKEGLLQDRKEADYVCYVNGKAIAIIEAKRSDIDITKDNAKAKDQVKEYSERFLTDDAKILPNINVIPFLYVANGKNIAFYNSLEENPHWENVNIFHTPTQLKDLFYSIDRMPYNDDIFDLKLRQCQDEALKKIEESFKNKKQRVFVTLATGSGKTFLACALSYRLLKFAHYKRILFLVDRNNLGNQAEEEFQNFKLSNKRKINEEYKVDRLKSPYIEPSDNIVITTIQRLYSVLTGERVDFNDEADDEALDQEFNQSANLTDKDQENEQYTPIQLSQDLKISQDFFDLIIIDECHRSIYKKWKTVLEYFNVAKILGITATPIPDTIKFFNGNAIYTYTYEQSVIDGVNIDSFVYRIKTFLSEKEINKIDSGENYTEIAKYDHSVDQKTLSDSATYSKSDINRNVVYPDQIRTIIKKFKEIIYKDLYPQREPIYDYIPKTIIFAQDQAHAQRIVDIIKEVFQDECKNNEDFVHRITSNEPNHEQYLRIFRNEKKMRIAVTVNLIATGTDVTSAEIVLFMRDVISETLYVQMKGRGCRTISNDKLKDLTPNAKDGKECFFIVDAVGVTEHPFKIKPLTINSDKNDSTSQKILSIDELLEKIAHGFLSDNILSQLRMKLLHIEKNSKEENRNDFLHIAGIDLHSLAERILITTNQESLPEFHNTSEPNKERKKLVEPLGQNPMARECLKRLYYGYTDIYNNVKDHVLEESGFSIKGAEENIGAFKQYIDTHKDQIKALEIIYSQKDDEPLTMDLLTELQKKLEYELSSNFISVPKLWNDFELVENQNALRSKESGKAYKRKVKPLVTEGENLSDINAITNLIQLVRFAWDQITDLCSIVSYTSQYFELWAGKLHRNITAQQKVIFKQIAEYIATNGACELKDVAKFDKKVYKDLIISLRSQNTDKDPIDVANDMVISLSSFLLKAHKQDANVA